MRAIAIFGPRTSEAHLAPFAQACSEASITRAYEPQSKADAVLIFGGDGTIHRHLRGLVHAGAPVLVVPSGSGNDFARSIGLPSRSAALSAWRRFCSASGNVHNVDLGVIQARNGASTYFCNIGGAGLDSETNRRANTYPAWLRARGGYILAALAEIRRWRPLRAQVGVPRDSALGVRKEWKTVLDEPSTFVAFANSPAYGDGMKMAPKAKLDDGLLDVCFVRKASKRRILTFFPTVFFGAHLRLPEVEYFQVPALRLETEWPMDVYADGEYVCKTPVEVSVRRGALRVIGP